MPTYFLRVRDRRRAIVHEASTQHRDLASALAEANGAVCSMLNGRNGIPFDPEGRVDIEDMAGRPLARFGLAELVGSMPLPHVAQALSTGV